MRTAIFFIALSAIDMACIYYKIEIVGADDWWKLAAAILAFCIVLDIVYAARRNKTDG